MAVIEQSIEVSLPPDEVVAEWQAFPFRSIIGYFRDPGRRLHWRDGVGNEAWGLALLIGLGRQRTRVCVKLEYYPTQSGICAAALSAHVSTDLTMFTRFVESDAAFQAAHELAVG